VDPVEWVGCLWTCGNVTVDFSLHGFTTTCDHCDANVCVKQVPVPAGRSGQPASQQTANNSLNFFLFPPFSSFASRSRVRTAAAGVGVSAVNVVGWLAGWLVASCSCKGREEDYLLQVQPNWALFVSCWACWLCWRSGFGFFCGVWLVRGWMDGSMSAWLQVPSLCGLCNGNVVTGTWDVVDGLWFRWLDLISLRSRHRHDDVGGCGISREGSGIGLRCFCEWAMEAS
jgi:hypothetical protein